MIKDSIVNWFTNKGIAKEDILANINKNYLELGYIDSFGFLELISYCESEFKISFEKEDLENNQIFSIEGIIDIISKKA